MNEENNQEGKHIPHQRRSGSDSIRQGNIPNRQTSQTRGNGSDTPGVIRFIDLFGGIGGFRLGLERANRSDLQTQNGKSKHPTGIQPNRFDIRDKGNSTVPLGNGRKGKDDTSFRCVYYCDIDKYAVQTYNKNFQEKNTPTDITQINAADLPDFDIICGGFPCQSFSIAGKREGFSDTRGTLFFEICRIASEKRPRMLFLENVKGLLSHDNGETFRVILESLDELGYDAEWQVLNSKNFGVPQNRERVFIIGHLRESGGRTVFPIREINTELDSVSGQRGQLMVERFPLKFMTRNQKNIEGDYAFTVDGANTGGVIVHSMQPRSPDRPSLKYSSGGSVPLNRKDGYTYCLDSGNCQAVELPIMNTLTEATGNRAGSSKEFLKSVDNIKKTTGQIRRLTPVECERLQGFPDNWTDGVSDTQRYKQLGNAVTVNVIQAIGERILEVW